MGKNKRKPIPTNPIAPVDPEDAVRRMVRGERPGERAQPDIPAGAAQEQRQGPPPKRARTTVTPGGLLRKTVYFTEDEWQEIRRRSFEDDVNYSDVVRRAVRQTFGLPPAG